MAYVDLLVVSGSSSHHPQSHQFVYHSVRIKYTDELEKMESSGELSNRKNMTDGASDIMKNLEGLIVVEQPFSILI